ncbi:hypothetical protein LTR15_007934 [Elasticomyces elasticus]|nr:hypothetical protein LTR15_007934 [Elasticomyces elasticus]
MIPPVQQHTELRYGACPTNEDLTTAFNNLPSPRTIYGGMPNHWIFAIRRLPFEPYSTVLVMAHPQSGDVYVLSGNSEADHVCPLLAGDPHAAVALLLAMPLQQQLEMEKFERLDTPLPANAEANQLRAYSSLATESVALATATAASLRARGVRESVCNVSVATKKQMQVLDQVWLRLASDTKVSLQVQFNALMTATAVMSARTALADKICHTCGISGAATTGLLKCSACSKAWYCSKDCQKTDWKKGHKTVCRSVASPSTGPDGIV